jgi:hypothetical protein
MLLITIFVELRVVAGRSRTRAGSPRPYLNGRAVPWPWEERHGQSMAWARHGHGMTSVNQTRPHCVNQMGKTNSKPLAARHGRVMLCVNRSLMFQNTTRYRMVPVLIKHPDAYPHLWQTLVTHTSFRPQVWPARSPELTPLEYFLLSHMKDTVYWQKSQASEALLQRSWSPLTA